jgi:hypothetical protein
MRIARTNRSPMNCTYGVPAGQISANSNPRTSAPSTRFHNGIANQPARKPLPLGSVGSVMPMHDLNSAGRCSPDAGLGWGLSRRLARLRPPRTLSHPRHPGECRDLSEVATNARREPPLRSRPPPG